MVQLEVDALDEDFVKSISQLLSDAGVPSVLWGDYLLTVYGVPSIIGGIEFVVPDEKVSAAVAALKGSNLKRCPDPRSCVVSREHTQQPAPSFHMHLGTSEVDVSIRTHSETLWFIPPPPQDIFSNARPQASRYIFASDDSILPRPRHGRGHGAFSKEGFPVVVPTAHTILEAYMRLSIAHREQYSGFYLGMMTYVAEYIDADGLLDDTQLPESCRKFWHDFKDGQRQTREMMNELQDYFDKESAEKRRGGRWSITRLITSWFGINDGK
ncbi:uncharacterized protein F4817DRAFT_316177 [Daldinia loculata]|uniref:uncharacterized protein n=1 Tax=Daldinia loculata TaxID=103429 RepID=UPI0020C3F337|nr:uncharacterized protein F4817DRAFT_316177 [Daldinia loculata]KAI1647084.1 hypothetical protein F4817DRAFT_316177 [Daldinia loculata]